MVDGGTLVMVADATVAPKFLELAYLCVSVVCFRTSPAQKASVVSLVQLHHPTTVTLAVGDGANDVNMIQTARIGIGITGREGRQAVSLIKYFFSGCLCLY